MPLHTPPPTPHFSYPQLMMSEPRQQSFALCFSFLFSPPFPARLILFLSEPYTHPNPLRSPSPFFYSIRATLHTPFTTPLRSDRHKRHPTHPLVPLFVRITTPLYFGLPRIALLLLQHYQHGNTTPPPPSSPSTAILSNPVHLHLCDSLLPLHHYHRCVRNTPTAQAGKGDRAPLPSPFL